ncbi:MAG: Ada metal-binding domain-containing protein, partial [Candidatus Binatus sp.]
GPNDATRTPSSASVRVLSSADATGQVVGNRRSKIYAWPGCGSYDTMAPQNRVGFPSRADAEQDGYRAARNCP